MDQDRISLEINIGNLNSDQLTASSASVSCRVYERVQPRHGRVVFDIGEQFLDLWFLQIEAVPQFDCLPVDQSAQPSSAFNFVPGLEWGLLVELRKFQPF